jgi:hypothetical protein
MEPKQEPVQWLLDGEHRQREAAFVSVRNKKLIFLYRSTVMGLQMGLINELPINQKYASKITEEHLNDPFRLA